MQTRTVQPSASVSSIYKLVFFMYILIFLSFLPLNILATIFAVSVTKLNVRLSRHFVSFVSFYNTITVTLGHFPVSYMLLISPVTILRPLSPLHAATYKRNYRLYLLRVLVRLLVFWSIRLIAEICNIILPNFHYLSLICYYIAF